MRVRVEEGRRGGGHYSDPETIREIGSHVRDHAPPTPHPFWIWIYAAALRSEIVMDARQGQKPGWFPPSFSVRKAHALLHISPTRTSVMG